MIPVSLSLLSHLADRPDEPVISVYYCSFSLHWRGSKLCVVAHVGVSQEGFGVNSQSGSSRTTDHIAHPQLTTTTNPHTPQPLNISIAIASTTSAAKYIITAPNVFIIRGYSSLK